ncbi:extracellular solute-binding protein [Paenibacillus nasutitermitis]|uniref:ABC transporter substrate-binding protein n=1 Tax=Paenibacillus nasutitermitis TaxID=1652958 RepID=A0A917DZX6_9BACL|nr:extracellular solute-binding protein [Paenibacillus nasutitermitis]GGD82860.1 ABC transporter substrate-binding protein [Paenibacillus nasutitermitis]
MKFNKTTAALLSLFVLLSLLSACSGDGSNEAEGAKPKESGINKMGMPIVADKINLKMVAGKAPTTASNWNEVMLWQEYEKLTNIHVTWEMVPNDNLTEKRNIMLAGGDYPDAFFTAAIPSTDLLKYGSQGVFIKLNDLIDQYAPNLKKLLDQYPEVRKGLTMPDGNIYSFPLIYDPQFTSVLGGGKVWIKKEWLDKLGLKEPETTGDFYNMLKAFKEKDPNGNNQADEIPFESVGLPTIISYFKGAWGIGTRGTGHANVDMDNAGKLRFIPTDPNYKQMLEYLNKLYSEKLIAEDIFTIQANQFYATGAKGLYGATITTSPYTLMSQTGYIGASALKGPHGDQLYSSVGSPLAAPGAFVITDKNKSPEATVRWMDYLYGEEGSKMFFMGFEGKSYEKTASGDLQYTKEITANPNGLTIEQALVKYVVWPGGGYPNMVQQKFFKGAESQPESIQAAEKFKKYMPKEVWPTFNYTAEESTKMSALSADINTYVSEMAAKFVSGKASFSEWDNYVATLKKMRLDEYMQIYQAAYDRYKK